MERYHIAEYIKNIVPEKVNVEDMMNARDRRACIQRSLLKEHGCPVISFTMNIAGPVKTDSDIAYAFDLGVERIEAVLSTNRIEILSKEFILEKTGFEYFASVDCDAWILKSYMTAIEDHDAVGRLFDIDVITSTGEKLSREAQHEMRRCLICGNDVFVCARSRAHSADELFDRAIEIIRHTKAQRFVKRMGHIAQRSLFYEVAVSPKPGLVDRFGNGSHKDMDFFTFIQSGSFLREYFENCVEKGIRFSEKGYSSDFIGANELFKAVNTDGIFAEKGMFDETNGINTHKGLIFSFGLILASAGYIYNLYGTDLDRLAEICSIMGRAAAGRSINTAQKSECGMSSDLTHCTEGIISEAVSGYKTVREYAMPFMEELAGAFGPSDTNLLGILLLLKLISVCSDTNMKKRSGAEAANALKVRAGEVLDKLISLKNSNITLEELEEYVNENVKKLDEEFIALNASPGGCADLLAVTFLMYAYKNE